MSSRRATKRRMTTGNGEQSPDPVDVAESGSDALSLATEDSYAVFHWPGPGAYTGEVAGPRGFIPRHGEMSLPPWQFKQALEDGLTFVRWASGSA